MVFIYTCFRIAIKEMTKKNIFSEVNGQMKLTPNEGLVHNNYYYLCGLITGKKFVLDNYLLTHGIHYMLLRIISRFKRAGRR